MGKKHRNRCRSRKREEECNEVQVNEEAGDNDSHIELDEEEKQSLIISLCSADEEEAIAAQTFISDLSLDDANIALRHYLLQSDCNVLPLILRRVFAFVHDVEDAPKNVPSAYIKNRLKMICSACNALGSLAMTPDTAALILSWPSTESSLELFSVLLKMIKSKHYYAQTVYLFKSVVNIIIMLFIFCIIAGFPSGIKFLVKLFTTFGVYDKFKTLLK
jgi:hypothetical protein